MTTDPTLQSRIRPPVFLGICIALTLLHGVLAFTAVSGKSSTYDEPMHALGAWVHWHQGDFRINFEDPPLWQYWATLLNSGAMKVDWNDQYWQLMPGYVYYEWAFTNDTLYRTPGNEGEAFVLRDRFMMVLLSMGLCAVVALWAWRLAGPLPAVIATAMVALDPNFLGHGALVKNDAPMALMMAAVFFMCWRVGQRLTWVNGLGLAFLVGAAVNVKFSALLFGPMLIILMGLRIFMPVPWEVLGKTLIKPLQRAVAVAGLFAVVGIVTFVVIWVCYGFRYDPSPDPKVQLNTDLHKLEAVTARFQAMHPSKPFSSDLNLPLTQLLELYAKQYNALAEADAQLRKAVTGAALSDAARSVVLQKLSLNDATSKDATDLFNLAQNFLPANVPQPKDRAPDFDQKYTQVVLNLERARRRLHDLEYDTLGAAYWCEVGDAAPDGFIRLLNIAMDFKLLPSAFLHGVLFVHARSIIRSSYLLGSVSATGWWYYFPLAMLFKTPVATLIALGGAAVMGVWLLMRKLADWRQIGWATACLLVPVGIYMFSVMTANLNIGIRHVLCVYPLMYVGAAALLVRALRQWPWIVRMHLFVLGGVLLIEALAAYPNYVAYFNFASGGSRGGLHLLGDSNLDWGQDLPKLKAWREQHMDAPLSLLYFGTTEVDRVASSGGVEHAQNWFTLPEFYKIDFDPGVPVDPEPSRMKGRYVAISATELQGVYNMAGPDFYAAYRKLVPTQVLGGTIYIYDLRK